MNDLQALLDTIAADARLAPPRGRVADYIPALASVDPARFGIALATVDGELLGSGDFREAFSVQSVSKAFALALVLARGGDALWQRVGRELAPVLLRDLVPPQRSRFDQRLRRPREPRHLQP